MDGRLVDGVAVHESGDPAEPGILLWPGLSSTSAYFNAVGALLPGRTVAADPPGFGSSPPPYAYSYEYLVERAGVVIGECDCRVMLGHSLGADISCRCRAASRTARGGVGRRRLHGCSDSR